MQLPYAGVAKAKALKAWTLLQPLLLSSKLADANKYVSPFCIVLRRIPLLLAMTHRTCPLADLIHSIIVLNLAEHKGSRRRH